LGMQFLGRQQTRANLPWFGDTLLEQNIVTQVDTFIADVGRRSGNEPLDFLRRFPTKRAVQHVPLCVFPRHGCSLSLLPALWVKRPESCRTGHRPLALPRRHNLITPAVWLRLVWSHR